MTESSGVPDVDAECRATLEALADMLIPSGDGFPSASEAGVAGELLDEVLRSRPDLRAPLVSILKRAAGRDPKTVIWDLEDNHPDSFAVLVEVVPGAYFMNEAVRRALGYPGQAGAPIEEADPPDYQRDGLLQSVIDRGPIFRDG